MCICIEYTYFIYICIYVERICICIWQFYLLYTHIYLYIYIDVLLTCTVSVIYIEHYSPTQLHVTLYLFLSSIFIAIDARLCWFHLIWQNTNKYQHLHKYYHYLQFTPFYPFTLLSFFFVKDILYPFCNCYRFLFIIPIK